MDHKISQVFICSRVRCVISMHHDTQFTRTATSHILTRYITKEIILVEDTDV
jgi:hypothetical protein